MTPDARRQQHRADLVASATRHERNGAHRQGLSPARIVPLFPRRPLDQPAATPRPAPAAARPFHRRRPRRMAGT